MQTPLDQFRNNYLDLLLDFLWREWSAIGVAGHGGKAPTHVVDPEALLLFTCTLGRYDARLFDEVMDWLLKNGRFINVQRLWTIAQREAFSGNGVLAAVADWLARSGDAIKWKKLATHADGVRTTEYLFRFPDGRSIPVVQEREPGFGAHGYARSPLLPRGYSQTFPINTVASRLLQLRALFGVNARCDVLNYLALNGTGHPREVARELYYSQKAIHDIMTDLECAGVVHSSRAGRERTFRLNPGALPTLAENDRGARWINWPTLLAGAEAVWRLVDELPATSHSSELVESEICLKVDPLMARFTRARWVTSVKEQRGGELGLERLATFQAVFEDCIE